MRKLITFLNFELPSLKLKVCIIYRNVLRKAGICVKFEESSNLENHDYSFVVCFLYPSVKLLGMDPEPCLPYGEQQLMSPVCSLGLR